MALEVGERLYPGILRPLVPGVVVSVMDAADREGQRLVETLVVAEMDENFRKRIVRATVGGKVVWVAPDPDVDLNGLRPRPPPLRRDPTEDGAAAAACAASDGDGACLSCSA